ncbi:hypothetical protein AQUCO_02200051v1 [Aquilegia coerulea]|uniref:Protein TIC 20 n=1 Tax=Aquilegia coerulea TaxID=218851 RepID=A0A2G5DD23_AQUCA|nr:hypothetical protein AQUCO_02200051v1 [Aquilegia coerulea]
MSSSSSNLLHRSSSLKSSHQLLKLQSLNLSSPIKSTNLRFQRISPPKALSITNNELSSSQTLKKPQFLFNPLHSNQSPNSIFKSTNKPKNVCLATYQTVPATDRLISIISYFIPFLGGLPYSFHLFNAFPILELIFDPLVPLLGFYKSIPFVNFLTFFGLYIGIVRDKKFSRFVRFNALQALLLEFLLVLPSLLNVVFTSGEGFGFALVQVIHSAIFVVIFGAFLYTLGLCLFGKTPRFPFVTDVIDMRLQAEDNWP